MLDTAEKKMVDEDYYLHYEKSKLNTDVVIARGFLCTRDYSGDFRAVKTQYELEVFYYFEVGKAFMIKRDWWSGLFYVKETAHPINNQANWKIWSVYPYTYNWGSLLKAIEGTPFKYGADCFLLDKDDFDMGIRRMAKYTKNPGLIEKLAKSNFNYLMDKYARGSATTSGAINWKAETIKQALRLNNGILKKIADKKISFGEIRLIQLCEKNKKAWTFESISELWTRYSWKIANQIIQLTNPEKLKRYIEKQKNKDKHVCHGDWSDYVTECKKLGLDLTDQNIIFPKNLRKAHQEISKLIRYEEDKHLDDLILKRAEVLGKLTFEAMGFIVRPAASSRELIDEGAALHHCVGGYAKRYANGHTSILFIRRKSKPEKPYYTMEIRENEIIQARTKDNKSFEHDSEMKRFIRTFERQKLNKKAERKAG